MILPVTHMSRYRRTITKIKNDLDNAIRYDVFITKGSKAIDLPNGLDYIFKMRGLWYVNVAVQMSGR